MDPVVEKMITKLLRAHLLSESILEHYSEKVAPLLNSDPKTVKAEIQAILERKQSELKDEVNDL